MIAKCTTREQDGIPFVVLETWWQSISVVNNLFLGVCETLLSVLERLSIALTICLLNLRAEFVSPRCSREIIPAPG